MNITFNDGQMYGISEQGIFLFIDNGINLIPIKILSFS